MKKHLLKSLLAVALLLVCGNVWGETKILTFDLSKQPTGWPTDNSTTLTNYMYTLDGTDYTFALNNVKCNSGYLMLTQPSVLGLPAIEGYKLAKVVAFNSGGCSNAVKVGISSSASKESYVDGGEALTWSTKGSSYTYTLSGTAMNTVYYLYVTNKNAQILTLELTYEDSEAVGPAKEDAGLAYATAEVSKTVSDDKFTNALTNPNSLAVTYSSSNVNVATVAANGEVTIVGEGQATIKASFAGNDSFKAGEATYVLTVTDPNSTFVVFAFDSAESLTALGITAPSSSSGTNLNASVLTVDPITMSATDGSTATRVWNSGGNYDLRLYKDGGSLTFSGATIKKIEFKGTANFTTEVGSFENGVWSGNAESVTFKATGTSKITAVNVSYVTASVKVATKIEVSGMKTTFTQYDKFEFGGTVTATYEDGSSADVTGSAAFSGYDMTATGAQTVTATYKGKTATYTITVKQPTAYASLAELVAAGEPTTDGKYVTVTLTDEEIQSIFVTSSGNRSGIYLQTGEQEVQVYCKDVPEEWMAGGTVSGTIICLWVLYKETWELQPKNWDDLEYTAPAPVTFTVTLNSNGFATYANANPTNIVSGAKAYYATECANGVVTFEEVEGAMCGSRGFLLQGEANATVTLEVVASATTVSSILWGFTEDTEVSSLDAEKYDWYALKGNQFLKLDGGTLKAGKAALRVKKDTEAKALNFRFGGTTMVEQLLKENEGAVIYDLLGRRVENATKGIYIINGKKVMVK